MSNNYGFNKYKQTSVTTASKGQVLLMLYEGAIKFTKLALEALKMKDIAKKGEYVLRVHDIVNELSLSLNHEVGGQISKELERLYMFIVDQLTEGNIKNDPKNFENALKILETLHEGWQGAVKQVSVKYGGDVAQAASAELQDKQNNNQSNTQDTQTKSKSNFTMSGIVGGKPVRSK